ncbi:MAG: Gldg family protein [Bacteroidales bacterium]|nr:Gldg family protein [Bacteroidales bacterium]
MKTKNTVYTSILLVIGVLILLNILSDKIFLRLDLTADKRYTLSKATKNILASLEEPVTIKAYFSENLPPDVAKTKTDFKDMLIEYSNRSKGMVVYEFINPNEDEEVEQEAMRNGIQPVLINVRDKDQVKQQKAFLGALIQMGEDKDVIPFMQPGAAMEYALSSSIKKLSVTEKPVIGFLQGHGEPSLRAMNQALTMLNVLYQVEPVTLSDSENQLERYETVAIIAPIDSFSSSDLMQLDNFLSQGKNLLIAMDRVNGDFSNAMGSAVNTGLEAWLGQKGLKVEENFVIDANCATVGVIQQQGPFRIQTQVNFPYLPIISKFEEHPITEGLEAVVMQFASTINYYGDTSLQFLPLIKSSEKSGTQSAPLYFDIQKQWGDRDFPLSGLTLGGILSGPIVGNNNSKLVVFSDGQFAVNGEGQQTQQISPDNVNLLVNAVDWLSDDTGLINLRTKGVTSRPLEQIEDSKKAFLKYFNFLLPILLVIIYGIVRMQMNRNIRIKRMEEGYV